VDALIAELEKIRCKAHNAPSAPRGANALVRSVGLLE
jgi:hypothetical protein